MATDERQKVPVGESQKDRMARRPMHLFLSPRYYGMWFALGLMRASTWLPYPLQVRFGRLLGRLLHKALKKRRLIANRNIELCFPELDRHARREVVRSHFESLGLSLIEMALGWWGSQRKIDRLMTIEGLEHLEKALEQGNGAILLTAHFTSVEASGSLFKRLAPPFKAMYRTNKNPFLDEVLKRGRLKSTDGLISKNDVKTMLRTLKSNTAVLYAPDQGYRRKPNAVVPFFSVPSLTNVATSQIARLTGAPVLPYLPIRLPDNQGYLLSILPPIEDFPGDDPATDAEKYHHIIEDHIRRDPSQYYWVHRRFKTDEGLWPDPYLDLSE